MPKSGNVGKNDHLGPALCGSCCFLHLANPQNLGQVGNGHFPKDPKKTSKIIIIIIIYNNKSVRCGSQPLTLALVNIHPKPFN